MYKWIFSNLQSLDLQTELIEACGWDEELADTYLEKVSNGLHPEFGLDIPRQVRSILSDAPDAVVEVIVKIVDREASEALKELMEPKVYN